MTANRKADLQRKLTLAPVAKPPAGLAERIKREIPKDLRFNAETERERLSKAVGFNLRVAASILILVSSAYLGLRFLSQVDERPQPPAQLPRGIRVPIPEQPKVMTQTADAMKEESQRAAAPPVAREKRARRDRQQPTSVASAPPPAAAPPPPPPAASAPAANAVAESITVSRVSHGVAGVAMERVEKKAATTADVETTTSPISGKEMRYFAKDKNVQVVVTSKLHDEQITPWASVSPAAKQKILEVELAAGGDRKAIARVAREAGLTEFADSIEQR
ncbi:MAG: hypothetical protein M3041_03970 [Acidobacteriota bacterium]|nr:hypothetical protein [Acidobacteriota bacterium]